MGIIYTARYNNVATIQYCKSDSTLLYYYISPYLAVSLTFSVCLPVRRIVYGVQCTAYSVRRTVYGESRSINIHCIN